MNSNNENFKKTLEAMQNKGKMMGFPIPGVTPPAKKQSNNETNKNNSNNVKEGTNKGKNFIM
jgi:hypothetical protein